MNLVTAIRNYLDGKKTYIIGALTALDGLYQYYVQHGSSWHVLLAYLFAGGSFATLRAAIAKVK